MNECRSCKQPIGGTGHCSACIEIITRRRDVSRLKGEHMVVRYDITRAKVDVERAENEKKAADNRLARLERTMARIVRSLRDLDPKWEP